MRSSYDPLDDSKDQQHSGERGQRTTEYYECIDIGEWGGGKCCDHLTILRMNEKVS